MASVTEVQILFELNLRYRAGHLAEVSRELLDRIRHRQQVVVESALRDSVSTRELIRFFNLIQREHRVEHFQEFVSVIELADPASDHEIFVVHFLQHLWRALCQHQFDKVSTAFNDLHFAVVPGSAQDPDAIEDLSSIYGTFQTQLVRYMAGLDFEIVIGLRGPLATSQFDSDWLERMRQKAREQQCDCPVCREALFHA